MMTGSKVWDDKPRDKKVTFLVTQMIKNLPAMQVTWI